MIRFMFIVYMVLMALPIVSYSQPEIQSVVGTINHGDIISISSTGTNFGTKSIPAPVVWDNVESGSFNPAWQSHNQLEIGSESRHSSSLYCGTANMAGSGGVNSAFFTGPNSELGESWFVQYWFMLDDNFDWDTGSYESGHENLANVKFLRMWNPGAIDENFHINLHGWADNAQYYAENVSNASGGTCDSGYMTSWTTGVWHCLQFDFKDSSVGGNDGVFRFWRDGQLIVEDTDIMTREDYSEFKRPFVVGFYDAWGDANTDRDDFYIDDAYIDNSLARVEIGNAATYAACTHREIQIPTAWATDAVSVQVNTGSFTADSTSTYLYVVDADGAVNSTGYSITINGAVAGWTFETISITAGVLNLAWTDPSATGGTTWQVQACDSGNSAFSILATTAAVAIPVTALADGTVDITITSSAGPIQKGSGS